MYPCCIA